MAQPETITISVKALTPIWTGDANRKTTNIKGTSLLGGLRFWTEALFRSIGKRACDITDEVSRDLFDPDHPKMICDVCNVFGCTGLGRSFSLKVTGKGEPKEFGNIVLDKEDCPGAFKGGTDRKPPTWYLKDPGLIGDFQLILAPLRGSQIPSGLILSLILMLKHGTLGAKDQYGHGVIKADIPKILLESAKKGLPPEDGVPSPGLSLKDFFFFKAKAKKSNIKTPFEIRCQVRNNIREKGEDGLRHYFCGHLKGEERNSTKYNIGIVGNELTGWGYFPRKGEHAPHREKCLQILYEQIKNNSINNELSWIEDKSEKRDFQNKGKSWPEFLNMLLEG